MHIRYWTAAAALLASAGLAACGGSSNSPGVASLSGSHNPTGGATTTTLPHGSPTQLLDEWATCMRQHGSPNQADPTIDANGVIHIQTPATTSRDPLQDGGPCSSYLTAASTALRGGQPLQKPSQAKLLKFAECMRSHGIPDFPDPSSGGLSIQMHPGSDLNPNNPTFKNASKTCAKKTGVPGFGTGHAPRGAIEATSGSGPGPGGGQIGGGAVTK
ncbi:MAG: hypothetical protein J2P57_25565 [Acidimicrobiaceae bacterium]|nr:hypothetical protein [Acidimicrobiaceae bacterium]